MTYEFENDFFCLFCHTYFGQLNLIFNLDELKKVFETKKVEILSHCRV